MPIQPRPTHSVSPTASIRSPKVQLVRHAPNASFNIRLSALEQTLLDNTRFDDLDVSSQDFDFEDIFTYNKPKQKLCKVVEVSLPARTR
ncbi:hypothetical protein PV08_00593 [Exophiala spinifera]|uniref:Uncharacterized protein n=1 Tax=Exophiala spinifera TaxID=91928 RepID=A0A0D2BM90_9EURO|nr:uncharacterized protein PV08_00593 [Exophiala spinifera]KIW20018.1 hypothetical protein PV08_00593 [Exophiala spinifera]